MLPPPFQLLRPAAADLARLEKNVATVLEPLREKVLANGLTVREHAKGRVVSFQLEAPSFPWATDEQPLVTLPDSFPGDVDYVLVLDVLHSDGVHMAGNRLDWSMDSQGQYRAIRVQYIADLDAGEPYTVTLLVAAR